MNKQTAIVADTPLAKLREPFAPHHISKLPKPTKAQTDKVKADFKAGVRCKVCGSWHHPDVIHLDYVGHAALTDRLLDTDPEWSWEPAALTDAGLPAFDGTGGLWIKLTVCGVTRLGYGHAAAKPNSDPGARVHHPRLPLCGDRLCAKDRARLRSAWQHCEAHRR